MKRIITFVFLSLALTFVVRAEDAQLQRAKMELLVEQAGEMFTDAQRKGSATHGAVFQYYYGLVYGAGTNILARKDSAATANLQNRYMALIAKNYETYTKVENAMEKAKATGSDTVRVGRNKVVRNGNRHRAKHIASAEKLGEKELAAAIREWENFVIQLKKAK